MRKKILFFPLFFCLGLGGMIAQNYIIFPYSVETHLQKESINTMGPTLNIADTWTNESVLAINALMKEYGEPLENTANKIVWVLNKPYFKKIVYTEYQSGNLTVTNSKLLGIKSDPTTYQETTINFKPENSICNSKQPQKIIY